MNVPKQSSESATPVAGKALSQLSELMLTQAGLNVQQIKSHQARICQALVEGKETWIPVVQKCTVNNGGVVSWKAALRFVEKDRTQWERKFDQSSLRWWMENHLVSFIPAAGAASRYLAKLRSVCTLMEDRVPQLAGLFEKLQAQNGQVEINRKETNELQFLLSQITLPEEFTSYTEQLLESIDSKQGRLVSLYADRVKVLLETGKSSSTVTSQQVSQKIVAESLEQSMRQPWQRVSVNRKSNQLATSSEIKDTRQRNQALSSMIRKLECYGALKITLEHFGNEPKAIVPTTTEGDTFLRLKLIEQCTLIRSLGTYFVAPDGLKNAFEQVITAELASLPQIFINPFELSPEGRPSEAKVHSFKVFEQSKDLCTIRFELDGKPYLTPEGEYSIVSAGHGELLSLFKKVTQDYPSAECLHIRNIDNVIGSTEERKIELSVPAELFRNLRDCLSFLRKSLKTFLAEPTAHGVFDPALNKWYLKDETLKKIALFLKPLCGQDLGENTFFSKQKGKSEDLQIDAAGLHSFLSLLFHFKPLPHLPDLEKWQLILQLLQRPISVFGVVRKETGDVGGGPVFADTGSGYDVKMCLEMPHANPSDSEEYFGTKGKSTHFNPVLVFFELQTEKDTPVVFENLFDERFWLLSKKEFQGKNVCYHETVLYELIGNAATTNLVFVEVPRTLFAPHKTIFDSLAKNRRSYGFHETLKET